MIGGQKSKQHFSNKKKKITLYMTPIPERLGLIIFIIGTLLCILCLKLGIGDKKETITFLVITIALDVIGYMSLYQTYLLFDVKNQRFVAKDFGSTVLTLPVHDIEKIQIVYDNECYPVHVVRKNGVEKIYRWTYNSIISSAMIMRRERQLNRLLTFAEECNEYLNGK